MAAKSHPDAPVTRQDIADSLREALVAARDRIAKDLRKAVGAEYGGEMKKSDECQHCGDGGHELGLKILDWHGGQGTPEYAAGSSIFSGRKIPHELATQVASRFESLIPEAEAGKHGWGPAEADQLADMSDHLRSGGHSEPVAGVGKAEGASKFVDARTLSDAQFSPEENAKFYGSHHQLSGRPKSNLAGIRARAAAKSGMTKKSAAMGYGDANTGSDMTMAESDPSKMKCGKSGCKHDFPHQHSQWDSSQVTRTKNWPSEPGAHKPTKKSEDLDKGLLGRVATTAALGAGLMTGAAHGAAKAPANKPAVAKKPPQPAAEKPTYLDMSGPAEKESEFPAITPKGGLGKAGLMPQAAVDRAQARPGGPSTLQRIRAKVAGVNLNVDENGAPAAHVSGGPTPKPTLASVTRTMGHRMALSEPVAKAGVDGFKAAGLTGKTVKDIRARAASTYVPASAHMPGMQHIDPGLKATHVQANPEGNLRFTTTKPDQTMDRFNASHGVSLPLPKSEMSKAAPAGTGLPAAPKPPKAPKSTAPKAPVAPKAPGAGSTVKAEDGGKDPCPHCGEDRNHESQKVRGGHVSTFHAASGKHVCGTKSSPPAGGSTKKAELDGTGTADPKKATSSVTGSKLKCDKPGCEYKFPHKCKT